MTPRTKRLVAALAAITAVTACTTTADGTPRPGSSTSESPSFAPTTSAKNEAPQVATPLDVSAFIAEPCSLLTTAQLRSLAVNPPGELTELDGAPDGCNWHGADGSFGIGWLKENEGGLSDTYRRGPEMNAYFIETSVDGYPGVFADGTDGRPSGVCGIVVGVSDTLTFYAQVSNGKLDADQSCTYAKQVATAAIATIKEAN